MYASAQAECRPHADAAKSNSNLLPAHEHALRYSRSETIPSHGDTNLDAGQRAHPLKWSGLSPNVWSMVTSNSRGALRPYVYKSSRVPLLLLCATDERPRAKRNMLTRHSHPRLVASTERQYRPLLLHGISGQRSKNPVERERVPASASHHDIA